MEGIASFGYWVRRRRKALDLTQEALAQQVGCSVSMIRMIETDERRPSKQIAERLAEQLEVAPEERAAFVKAARAERAVDRLAPPSLPSDRLLPKGLAGETTRPGSMEGARLQYPLNSSLPLPSGIVTFLFTDIEGSTRLWEQHREAMQVALARHDVLLRHVITAYAGVVVKTAGDGVYSVFVRSTDALSIAARIC